MYICGIICETKILYFAITKFTDYMNMNGDHLRKARKNRQPEPTEAITFLLILFFYHAW